MNILIRSCTSNSLESKDILDVSLNMSVESVGKKFILHINGNYDWNQEFESKEDAENQMIYLTNCKNALEAELREQSN